MDKFYHFPTKLNRTYELGIFVLKNDICLSILGPTLIQSVCYEADMSYIEISLK